ncbi:MAG: hypothetical protein JWN90_567 [Parcubacteria group bacterium]|nr:hypothetical protein [Parcubacteria group bacterium]
MFALHKAEMALCFIIRVMNRVLWHFRARDEEPTLHDVVDLLEEVLIQGRREDKINMKFSTTIPH